MTTIIFYLAKINNSRYNMCDGGECERMDNLCSTINFQGVTNKQLYILILHRPSRFGPHMGSKLSEKN